MRVLIVEDSSVFRNQLKAAMRTSEIEIAGTARHGGEAIEFLKRNPCDLMVLDLEMPVMDGITTLKTMKQEGLKTKVIVFAATTVRGAKETFEALKAGAMDVVAKPSAGSGGLQESIEQIRSELIPKILQFAPKTPEVLAVAPSIAPLTKTSSLPPSAPKPLPPLNPKDCQIIVIGSSTGGPVALENLLSGIPKPTIPILIVQHMPPTFTKTLAQRLENLTQIPCDEAKPGEPIMGGRIYVAPGDFHLHLSQKGTSTIVYLDQTEKRNYVRPAVDYLFETAASIYGPGVLGFILTGMGEDGAAGAKAIKTRGGRILIQDEATSVVWGMPGAAFRLNAYDDMLPILSLKERLIDILRKKLAA